jgi:hypothetical protein
MGAFVLRLSTPGLVKCQPRFFRKGTLTMTRLLKLFSAFAIFAACAFAQASAPVPGVDYPSPIPVPFIGFTTGSSDPVRCVPGRSPLNYRTDLVAFHYCSARNVWSSLPVSAQACSSTAACKAAIVGLKVVQGSGNLASGSPSTFAVTGISPAFTSASTFTCTAQDTTTIANNIGVLAAGYVSGSAVTFTGPNTNTDGFKYSCVGY